MATSSSDKQGNTGEGECRINVELLRKEIDNAYKMEGRPSNVSIYRVPDYLKRVKKEAYVPHTLSIGPYHIRSINTPDQMERHKLAAVGRYLKRLNGKSIEFVIEEIQKLEHEIRDCYEDPITDLNAKDFAWTFTKNACFVLEFLRSLSGEKFADDSSDFVEPIFNVERLKRVLGYQLVEDILMLENQIPLLLLRKLLHMEAMESSAEQKRSQEDMLAELLKSLVDVASPFPISTSELVDTLGGARHLLEFLNLCVSKWLRGKGSEGNAQSTQTTPGEAQSTETRQGEGKAQSTETTQGEAQSTETTQGEGKAQNTETTQGEAQSTETTQGEGKARSTETTQCNFISHPSDDVLHNAGIEFKFNTSTDDGQIYVRFEKTYFGFSKLFVPTVRIRDTTEIILRNLLAFEECGMFGQTEAAISRYVFLMNSLINSENDVALLRDQRIIASLLRNDKEVVDLFTVLCKGITLRSFDALDNVIEDIDRDYSIKIKSWMAEFIRQSHKFIIEYCSKPSHVIAVMEVVYGVNYLGNT